MAGMRKRVLLAVTMVAMLVAGCSGGDDGEPSTTGAPAATTTTTVPTVTTAAVPTTAATTVPVPGAVVLRPDGLGVVGFGATKDATVTALSAAFGAVDETGVGCELAGADVTTSRWDELRVQFVSGVFESYTVRPPNGEPAVLGLKTEAGIGVGSTVAQLKAAYGAQVKIPGLPPEFGGDDFAVSFPGTDRFVFGSLSATADTGMVRAIFTQVCE